MLTEIRGSGKFVLLNPPVKYCSPKGPMPTITGKIYFGQLSLYIHAGTFEYYLWGMPSRDDTLLPL